MQRHRQTFEEIISQLSSIHSEWKDDRAGLVIELLGNIPEKSSYTRADLRDLLEKDFKSALTLIQLMLDVSKDELTVSSRNGGRGFGVKAFRSDPEPILQKLEGLGVLEKLRELVSTPVTWRDLLVERLKMGRGRAIKAQKRGRFLEDQTKEIVRDVFGIGHFDVGRRFISATGESNEKADFAIPSKEDPRILIEVKAYGATGSKQTDILGDMERIIGKKRHDTTLLFVTDGITWTSRPSDLRKLIEFQNQGKIARIYTSKMFPDLREDLLRLRSEHGLDLKA
jgi:DpnII restriction endonuclease